MPPGLELKGIQAGYGPMQVLFDVDIRVPGGSVVALLGPNGSGKTTTLRVAAGLIRPRSGHVFLENQQVTGYTTRQRTRSGMCLVPEGRGIFPNLTVKENLLLHTHLRGRKARVEIEERSYLRFPLLGSRRNQLAATLSGGEQQMLSLTRALTTEPRVLMLDEISMGLAPLVVDELFGVVQELAKDGMTILVVEQLVRDALQIADYVVLLSQGRVMSVGQPADVEAAIESSYLGGGHGGVPLDELPDLSGTEELVATPSGTMLHRRYCPIVAHRRDLVPGSSLSSPSMCGMCEELAVDHPLAG